jgi:hypothetical protein
MAKHTRRTVWLLVLTIILIGSVGCSGKNAECKVTLDKEGNMDIIVNPPGESGEAKQDGTLKRSRQITPGKSTTTYEGEIVKTYAESGSSYTIQVFVQTADDRLMDYELEVSGGVYGDTPHTCSK